MSADIHHAFAPVALPAAIARLLGVPERRTGQRGRVTVVGNRDAASPDAEQLRAAFAQFTSASHRLEVAYAALQERVERLSNDLVRANQQLERELAEKQALAQQLSRQDRLAVMGEMAARVAHQLRTPLATAVLYASQLTRVELGDAERVRFSEKTLARLRHLERMTREVLRFARGDVVESSEVAVDALIDEAAVVMAPLMAGRGVVFCASDESGGALVNADRAGLLCALTSLLENALQATSQGGKVQLAAMANSARVTIRVTDTGCGIPAQVLERVFEPFFTTRADGTGLGLAIVRSSVQACGGTVEVTSKHGEGSRFVVSLPRVRPGTPPLAARAVSVEPSNDACEGTRRQEAA